MFADVDMSGYSEVLFWRQYSKGLGITHNVPCYEQKGNAAVGLTRGLVDNFVMANGLPIYASGSGYLGDDSAAVARKNRDGRLWLFLKTPGQINVLYPNSSGDHAIFLDCNTLDFELVPVKLEGIKVLISNTHSPHKLDSGAYNQRVAECKQAVELISKVRPINYLAELSEADFKAVESALESNPIAHKRARHVVTEVQRTTDAVKALKAGEIEKFGKMMNASHVSLRDDYEVTGLELDTMSTWGKGMVWVNGYNLGRFWKIGPTQTLCVPDCFLKKGKNEIIVLDIDKPTTTVVTGLDHPILDRIVKNESKDGKTTKSLNLNGANPVANGTFSSENGWKSVTLDAVTTGRYFCFEALNAQNPDDKSTSAAEFEIIGEDGNAISSIDWKVVFADSEETVKAANGADKLFDLQESIIWQTKIGDKTNHPHQVVIDMKQKSLYLLFVVASLLLSRPISAEIASSIGNLQSFKQEGNKISIQTDNATMEITAYQNNIIRVRAFRNAPSRAFSFAIDQQAKGSFTNVTEDGSKLTAQTSGVRIEITKSPLRISFYDKNGKLLNADDSRFGITWLGTDVTCYKKLFNGEKFIGLGEKTGPLNKRSLSYENWNSDVPAYALDKDPLYATIPFYIGIHDGLPYGIFFDNTHRSTFSFGASTDGEMAHFGAVDGEMDYYFFAGNSVRDIIEGYTCIPFV